MKGDFYMAKILKTDLQINALQEINKKLKYVEGLNILNDLSEEDCFIDLIRGNKKVHLPINSDELIKLLVEYRKNYVSDIKKLSNKYSILLDESDLDILEPERNKAIETNISVDNIESDNYNDW